jgi:hypothetical protein
VVGSEKIENTDAFWSIFMMAEEKRPTLDELLEELDCPLIELDWRSDDLENVQPEPLAESDPDRE